MAIIFGGGATGSRWYFGRIQNWWWRIRIRMRHITVTWGTIADLVCIIGSINRHRYRWPRWRLCDGIMFTSASDITTSSRRITTCHSWWSRRLDWRPSHHRHDTLCMFTYSTEASNISCKKNSENYIYLSITKIIEFHYFHTPEINIIISIVLCRTYFETVSRKKAKCTAV